MFYIQPKRNGINQTESTHQNDQLGAKKKKTFSTVLDAATMIQTFRLRITQMSKFSTEINTVPNTYLNISVRVPSFYKFLFSAQIIMHGQECNKYQDH